MCANNYGNWLAVDKVIAKIIWLTFLAHPVQMKQKRRQNTSLTNTTLDIEKRTQNTIPMYT